MRLKPALTMAAVALITAVLAAAAPRPALAPEARTDLDLRQDIQLLNLVNGLYLTPEQMQALVKEIRVAEQLQAQHQTKMQQYSTAADPVLRELRQTLMAGGKASEQLAQRVSQVQGPIHKEQEELNKKTALLVDDVRKILNENQIELIRDYRPCMIPPYSPNSSPIGRSADDLGPSVKLLERIRSLPARAWQNRKEQIVGRLEEYALYRERVELTREQKQRILDSMEKARTLSDVEWQGQKEALATAIQPAIRPDRAPKGDLLLNRKVGEFMLNPRLAPILEARLAQSAQTAQTHQ